MLKKDLYVVIGNPVAHSRSPIIHTLFAEQTKQSLVYEKLLSPVDQFKETVLKLISQGGKGANVTVPFKFDAFQMADELTKRAQLAQAVNTLSFKDGKIYGDNTDGAGLVRDIKERLLTKIEGAKVLLLGAGGAAYGVALPLLSENPACLHVANRTISKAQELVNTFLSYGNLKAESFEALNESYDIVINATSAGLQGQAPAISSSVFKPTTLAYDMVYSDKPTPFMQMAFEKGAKAVDGLGMLVEQAAESFYIWRGVRPNTLPVMEYLQK